MTDDAGGQQHDLTITRTLNAPKDLVWKAFTERDWLLRWYCPKNFEVIHAELDARVGGSWRIGMRSSEGNEHFMNGTFTECTAPSRLVMTQQWESGEGQDLPAGSTTMIVGLSGEGDTTQMVFRHEGLPSEESKQEHNEGWSEAFDNLSDCLGQEAGS